MNQWIYLFFSGFLLCACVHKEMVHPGILDIEYRTGHDSLPKRPQYPVWVNEACTSPTMKLTGRTYMTENTHDCAEIYGCHYSIEFYEQDEAAWFSTGVGMICKYTIKGRMIDLTYAPNETYRFKIECDERLVDLQTGDVYWLQPATTLISGN